MTHTHKLWLTRHFKYADPGGCDGPHLGRGRADVGLEDIPDHAEVGAGEDRANTSPTADPEQWTGGQHDLVVHVLHLGDFVPDPRQAGQVLTTGGDLGGGVLWVANQDLPLDDLLRGLGW